MSTTIFINWRKLRLNDLDLNKAIIKMKNTSQEKRLLLDKRNERQLHIKPKKRLIVTKDDNDKYDV